MINKIKVYMTALCICASFLASSCVTTQGVKDEKVQVQATATVVSESKTPVEVKKPDVTIKTQKAEATPTIEPTVEIKKEEATKEATVVPAATEVKTKIEPKKTVKPVVKAKKTPVAALKKSATGDEQVDSLIDRMNEAKSDKIATKALLTIKTIYAGASPQVVKGTAVIKKKDKFKIHYTEPQEQIIISDGKTIWVYTPAMQQVIKQTVESANVDAKLYTDMGNSIAYFARNSKTTLTEDDVNYNLVMAPSKDKGIMYDEITARIDKKTLDPVFMGLKYEGAATEVTFTDTVNYTEAQAEGIAELMNKNFNFTAPEGVEVIEAAELMQGLTK